MPRILIVAYSPDDVDFSDPGTPPGLDLEKLWAGTNEGIRRIRDHGWVGVQCMIPADDTAAATVERVLSEAAYDCIVIGGGVRLSHKAVPVFESVVDTIRRLSPDTPLAFNEAPDKSLEAAQRWLRTT